MNISTKKEREEIRKEIEEMQEIPHAGLECYEVDYENEGTVCSYLSFQPTIYEAIADAKIYIHQKHILNVRYIGHYDTEADDIITPEELYGVDMQYTEY